MTTQCQYFGTDGIRGRVGDSLINPEFVLKLGWAIGKILGAKNGNKIVIGKDTRVSGYMIESALEAGLSASGINVRLVGPMPTPAIAYLTRTLRCSAGIVISASHNPYHDNGLKFFSADGYKLPDEVELAVEAKMAEPLVTVDSADLGKVLRLNDAPGRYIEFCKSILPTHVGFKGLKIVVDCANGANYHIAPKLFRELGATVIEMGTSPDGFNINDFCGSTHTAGAQKLVQEEKADLGVAFDGDGDRVLMIDNHGEVVDGDEILFIMAKSQLHNNQMRGGIVGTTMSNLGFERAITGLGLGFERAKVGDRNVLARLKAHQWTLGGEPSGHIVDLDLTTTGDGIVSALQVVRAVVESEKTLAELKQGMTKYPQSLVNVAINKNFDMESQLIQAAIQKAEQALGETGRVLVRKSGTEPVVRVMVEGEKEDYVQTIAQDLAGTLARASQVS